jgi:anti-sigma B factor antagonist
MPILPADPGVLKMTARTDGEVTVIGVVGELDAWTAPLFRERVGTVLGSGNIRIVIDLSGCEFLDSTGLGLIVGALKRAVAAGGGLAVACDCERLLKTFRITGLDKVLAIRGTAAEAALAVA